MPEELVMSDMMMIYKKKFKDCRALGLLNNSYKTFSVVLLRRMVLYIKQKLSHMKAGFRKDRGCLDNILIVTMAINYPMSNLED